MRAALPPLAFVAGVGCLRAAGEGTGVDHPRRGRGREERRQAESARPAGGPEGEGLVGEAGDHPGGRTRTGRRLVPAAGRRAAGRPGGAKAAAVPPAGELLRLTRRRHYAALLLAAPRPPAKLSS